MHWILQLHLEKICAKSTPVYVQKHTLCAPKFLVCRFFGFSENENCNYWQSKKSKVIYFIDYTFLFLILMHYSIQKINSSVSSLFAILDSIVRQGKLAREESAAIFAASVISLFRWDFKHCYFYFAQHIQF